MYPTHPILGIDLILKRSQMFDLKILNLNYGKMSNSSVRYTLRRLLIPKTLIPMLIYNGMGGGGGNDTP